MTRNTVLLACFPLLLVIVIAVIGQDKIAPPTAPLPQPAVNTDTKLIALAKNEDWEIKDGKAHKQFTVETAGYSEARFTIMVSPRGERRDLGTKARGSILVSTFTSSGGFGQVMNPISNLNNKPVWFELVTTKIYHNRTLFMVSLFDLEAEKIAVSIDAYLVK